MLGETGITGGIGSGKSVVARIFQCLGIPVYDADSHAKRLMTTDGNLADRIREEFGNLSYSVDGVLNREYLASAVFSDPARLRRLNELVHPAVTADYRSWRQSLNEQRSPYSLKEAALLLNAAAEPFGGKVIVVTAPQDIRLERVMKRDGRNREEVLHIMSRQMSEQEMLQHADFVIQNDGVKPLIPQVLDIHSSLLRSIASELHP